VRGVSCEAPGAALAHLEQRRPGEAKNRIPDHESRGESQATVCFWCLLKDSNGEGEDEHAVRDE
jgi:hypothetical protein